MNEVVAFFLGVFLVISIWLFAKILAWLIPNFRKYYNQIFLVNGNSNNLVS